MRSASSRIDDGGAVSAARSFVFVGFGARVRFAGGSTISTVST
jgi:hypothetical protein